MTGELIQSLEQVIKSPSAVREYCLSHKINAFDLFSSNFLENLVKRESKTEAIDISKGSRSKKVSDASAAIRATIIDFKDKYKDNEISFYEFVSSFSEMCAQFNIPLDPSIPTEGFVANELYNFALKQKEFRGQSNNRISYGELDELLGIRFNESKKHIVGLIEQEYISQKYPIYNNHIVFRDKEGKIYNNPRIEGVKSWPGESKQIVREILAKFIEDNLIQAIKTDEIRYLGLEGPNFASFREIHKIVKQHNKNLSGLFVEHNNRSANLMRSIVRAHENEFRSSYIIEGNIDDIILLDIPKNYRVKLLHSDNGRLVDFLGEQIPLNEYYKLIDAIDSGESFSSVFKRTSLSNRFISEMANRFIGNFDVVFLDYVGGHTHKRNDVLESLVKHRINNQAVIAVTYNVANRIVRNGREQIQNSIFDKVFEIFSHAGYKVVEGICPENYQDSADIMCFHTYFINRKD